MAILTATEGVASGTLAGRLHRLDAVDLGKTLVTIPVGQKTELPGVRSSSLDLDTVVDVYGYRCVDGTQAMIDLAATLDDLKWEQALESALRKQLTSISQIEARLSQRQLGNGRIRRVLAQRPPDAPATGSLLETLAVQLIRLDPSLPSPRRQVEVRSVNDTFLARVDLAWPEHGLFLELDGQQHLDQPVYDARRETAVVATTGWLPGRFTWYEINRISKPTLRRIAALFDQASKRWHPAKVS